MFGVSLLASTGPRLDLFYEIFPSAKGEVDVNWAWHDSICTHLGRRFGSFSLHLKHNKWNEKGTLNPTNPLKRSFRMIWCLTFTREATKIGTCFTFRPSWYRFCSERSYASVMSRWIKDLKRRMPKNNHYNHVRGKGITWQRRNKLSYLFNLLLQIVRWQNAGKVPQKISTQTVSSWWRFVSRKQQPTCFAGLHLSRGFLSELRFSYVSGMFYCLLNNTEQNVDKKHDKIVLCPWMKWVRLVSEIMQPVGIMTLLCSPNVCCLT